MKSAQTILGHARKSAYNSFILENRSHGGFKVVKWDYDENSHFRNDSYRFAGTVLKRKGIFKRKYQIYSLSGGREENDSPLANCSTKTSILEKILNLPLNLLRMWPSDSPIGAPEFMRLVGVDNDFLRELYDSGRKTFEANYFYPDSCFFL